MTLLRYLSVDVDRLFQNYCLGMWMHDMQRLSLSSNSGTAASGIISVPLVHYLLSAVIVVVMILWKVVWSVKCTTQAAQVFVSLRILCASMSDVSLLCMHSLFTMI